MVDDERQRFSAADVELGEMPQVRMDGDPVPPPPPVPSPAPKLPPKDEEPIGLRR